MVLQERKQKPISKEIEKKKKSKKFEDRLSYYSEKYGDSFTVKPDQDEEKKSPLNTVKKIFKKKKKK